MDEIPISTEQPPIYEILHKRFGVEWDRGIIIAYDGKIHSKFVVQPQKVVHEKIHLERQKQIGNATWWRLYCDEPQFRLDEEVLAMREEILFLRKYIKDRELLFHLIREIRHSLASNIYGKLCTVEEANKLLK